MIHIPRKDKFAKTGSKPPKRVYKEDNHKNASFYASKPFRKSRAAYIERLILVQYYYLETIDPADSVILLQTVPICERCLELFRTNRRKAKELRGGFDLDHIDPINPDNALDSEGWGEPLDPNNYQLLCKKHHRTKTNQRDVKIIKRKQK